MNLALTMDQVAQRLHAIDGLRVVAHPPGRVNPPQGIVSYPDRISYDATYARGMDRIKLPVLIVFGQPTARSTRDMIAAYCDGNNPKSVKQTLESGNYTAFDEIVVEEAVFDVLTIASIDYMAALFMADIGGSGQ